MSIIERLAKHPVAANLMMIMAFVAGLWGVSKLNTQFLPPFDFKIVTVRTAWLGASPEDVERNITEPLEQELRTIDFLSEMTSTSAQGVSNITLEFSMNTDISTALDQVKERVNQIDTLPEDADPPVVSHKIFYELISTLVITGFEDLGEVRRLVRNMEQSLLDDGIAKVDIRGLPEEEIAIQIPSQNLYELQQPITKLAEQIRTQSLDAPAGTVGRNSSARQLRSEQQRREAQPFDELIVSVDEQGRLIQLGEIAEIKRQARLDETFIFRKGKPAVEMRVYRVSDSDALDNAAVLQKWLKTTRPTLPQGVEIIVLDERWYYIADRIGLLLKNGAGGLLLVILTLYLFLNSRIAFWVAAGIPTVFLAALALMAMYGESLNMLSLFALIMVLGIVVDDAIVVGEDTLSEYEKGLPPLEAATTAAHKMASPVVSSSLTTIAAFMPLLLLSDLIGDVLFSVPLVVIIVILCSLLEAFLILPGHLHHALKKPFKPAPAWRERFEQRFNHFREVTYLNALKYCLHHRAMTFASTFCLFLFAVSLVLGGRVAFTFFPSPEASTITAYVQFVSGTPPDRVTNFLNHMEEKLYETNEELGGDLIVDAIVFQNLAFSETTERNEKGPEFGTIFVELIEPDARKVRNPTFIDTWYSLIDDVAYIENLNIESPKTGPPGIDIDVELSGADPDTLKAAALALRDEIRRFEGVYNVEDDFPFGRTQWLIELTPQGRTLGLTPQDIARQLFAAFEGQIVQTFYDQEDEVEVRVMLPDSERHLFTRFESFPLVAANGEIIMLGNAASFTPKVGMQALRHTNGKLTVHVTGEVDLQLTNANRVLASIRRDVMPGIVEQFAVQWSFEGTSKDEEITLGEMRTGAIIGVILIYLILAWILASYALPFIVITAIPIGITGAIFGHALLGMDLTLLSLFGLFGLAGVVVNGAIILILTYFRHKENGLTKYDAILQAGRDRLRAVILTSLTTIGGLLPLMFETSLQAQFLIPMAVSITFGLAFATLLILIVIPCLITAYEDYLSRP
jgi:multidrug efflux pump subunit AcrB